MLEQKPDENTVRAVLERACRAPSLHNSQPWRWRWDGSTLELFVDAERLLPGTDPLNRQGILACGALLDHALVAWAAAGWEVRVNRFPEPPVRANLAALSFAGRREPFEIDVLSAAAIDSRYTDRSPMAAPGGWAELEPVLQSLCRHRDTALHVVDPRLRAELDGLSRTTAKLRRHDPRYQTELLWWAGAGTHGGAGIPAGRLPSAELSAQVPVNRSFPVGALGAADEDVPPDDAMIVVLSSRDDTVESLLWCGEALSAVLLECTVENLSTCVLTHVTELASARARVAELAGPRFPQMLVRLGRSLAPPPPRTPRRDTDEVLEVVDISSAG
ncbi:Acg family FMN-binding oxidoreductase [Nocardia rhamnosiphila]|uniref:Acg family FMN-binding oxidoreductase n=1 Tax=Nocardia rhamnosiphila TaxID=426716 RepID=UPI0037B867F9